MIISRNPRLENRLYQLFPQIFQFGEQGISLALIPAETAHTQPFDSSFFPFIERNKGQKGYKHREETDPPFGEDHDEEVEQEQQEAEDADAAYDIAVTNEECLAISEADGFMKRLFLPPRCLPEDFA